VACAATVETSGFVRSMSPQLRSPDSWSSAIIVAFVVEVARGHDGSPYAWLGAIGGIAYLLAIAVLRLRG